MNQHLLYPQRTPLIRLLGWDFVPAIGSVILSLMVGVLASCHGASPDWGTDSDTDSSYKLNHPHDTEGGKLIKVLKDDKQLEMFFFMRGDGSDLGFSDGLITQGDSDEETSDMNLIYPVVCLTDYQSFRNDEVPPCSPIYYNAFGDLMALNLTTLERSRWYSAQRQQLLTQNRGYQNYLLAGLVVGWGITPTALLLQFGSYDYTRLGKFGGKEATMAAGVAGLVALTVASLAYLDYEKNRSKTLINDYWLAEGAGPVPDTRLKNVAGIRPNLYDHLLLFEEEPELYNLSTAQTINSISTHVAREYNEAIILYGLESESIDKYCLPSRENTEPVCEDI